MTDQATDYTLDHLKDTLLRGVNYIDITEIRDVYYLEFTVSGVLTDRMKLLGIQTIECAKESSLLISYVGIPDIFKFDGRCIVPFNIAYALLSEPDESIDVDIFYPNESFPSKRHNAGKDELLTFIKFVVDNDSYSYKKVLEFWKKYHQLYIQQIDRNIQQLGTFNDN